MANCVGSQLLKPAHLTTDAEWSATIAANLTSAFHVLRSATARMMRSGGGGDDAVGGIAVEIGGPFVGVGWGQL